MKRRLQVLIFFLFMLSPVLMFSTHIVGGTLNYVYNGNNNYTITLKLFRDCGSGTAAFPASVTISVLGYNGATFSPSRDVTMTLGPVTAVPSALPPCAQQPNPTPCTQQGIYTTTVTLPPNPGGYHLYYQQVARNLTLTNVNAAGNNVGESFYAYIPGPTIGWDEDFTLANGTTVDNGATAWSVTNGTPAVTSGAVNASNQFEFQGANNGIATWTSQNINISGFTGGANLQVDLAETGNLENSDSIHVYYSVNGGPLIQFTTNGMIADDFGNAVASQTGVVGTTIKIVVVVHYGSSSPSSETYQLDNVIVSQNNFIQNSNPVFTLFPPLFLCLNTPFTFDHSATDADGDSLVYQFYTPYDGDNNAGPLDPTFSGNTASFTPIVFLPGYSTTQPLGASPLNLNSSTGSLTGSPGLLGQFVVGILVKEYRNGVYLSSTLRDFQFNVVNCPQTLAVTINPQTPTICFGSTSTTITANATGGTPPYTYLWNGTNAGASQSVGVGTYSVTVTDSRGCTSFAVVSVTAFTAAINANAGPDQTKCVTSPATAITGTITAASGGVWSNGGGTYSPNTTTTSNMVYTPTAAEIAAGHADLYLTTTGNGTCPSDKDTIRINYLPFTGTVTPTTTGVSCFGGSNGTATVNITGGSTPFTYFWNTSPSHTTQTITGLGPGTYSVTITDNIGCTQQTTATVTQPAVLSASATGSVASCTGGSISTSVTGGTSPYTYLWAPGGQTTASVSGLSSGTYTVTVTDSKGCTTTASASVAPPAAISVSVSGTSPNCFGGSNGSAVATVTGGIGPFTYSWSPSGGTAATATGLAQGTYTVSVTDSRSCSATGTVTITQPATLTATASATNETCDYLNNGTATVTAGGGTPSFSYSWAPGGQTTASVSSLAAGTYTVTVTDSKGCTKQAFATVSQPPALTATFGSQVNVSCFGGSNGSVTASATGGTAGYTYLWAPGGSTSATVSGLSTGSYTVTITDSHSCAGTNTVTITQPAAALSVSTSGTNVSCNGGNTGSVTATPSGGTAPYSYVWSPGGQTTATISSQVAGTYTVTVTDSKGCTANSTKTITQPTALSVSLSGTDVSCTSGSNGAITSTVSGGTPAYSYTWSPGGQTTGNVSGLVAGTYTVSVRDNLNCTQTASLTITQPTTITVSAGAVAETCDYLNNGSATATVSGGTPGYTYLWAPGGQTAATATGLSSGSYTVTVTDSKGCIKTATTAVTQPAPVSATFGSQTNVSCFGGSNASVTATGTGGTPNYTYNWMPGSISGATASGLSAGSYTVTITDSHSCTGTNTVTITQPAVALSVSTTATNVSCNGGSNGTITATPSGGTSPYTYSWAPGGQTTSAVNSLVASTYTVTVTDSKGCTATSTKTITQPTALSVSLSGTNVSCNAGSNGAITSSVSGGTPAYSYAWSPGGQTSGNVSGLVAGSYTVSVRDNLNCLQTASVTITEPTVLTLTVTPTPETCDYSNNGQAAAAVSGGTPGYSYSWAPGGQTGATATSLSSGSYTVTVTDSKGCIKAAVTSVTQPSTLAASFSNQTNVSCFGGNNASVTVTGSGGTPNYTYAWMPGSLSGANVAGLSAGTYTVTVTDAHSCTGTNTVTITQPASVLSVSGTSTPANCNDGTDGTVSATGAGGTAPYINYTWMPGNLVGQNISNLSAGTYTVTVTDNKNCTASNTVVVSEPAAIVPTLSTVSSTCTLPNGSASASVTGGAPGYTYQWFPSGGTGATTTPISSGSYTVLVTDSHGCTASQSVNVNDNSGPSASIFATTNVTCNGGSDGTATVGVVGGTGTLVYQWSPTGGNGPVATGLVAGTYTISVTDANGCQSLATTSPPISEPPPILIGITPSAVSCFGGTNGSASAVATGGTGTLNYLWQPGNTTGSSVSGLSAGTYTLQVTDANSCVKTQTFVITQPSAALAVSASSTNVSCFGGSNGTASSTVSGGTAPYTYTWMPGSISGQNITNLTAANYTINITDSHGCIISGSSSVTQPTVLSVTAGSTNSTCSNPNGSASALATGGTGTYSYLWSPGGQTTSIISGAASGSYTIHVTDANSCTASAPVTISNTAGPVVTVTSTNNVTCNGAANGTATTNVTGGTGTISYLWTPSGGNSSIGTNLSTGVYTVTVSDVNGCQSQATTAMMTQPQPISVDITTTAVSCFGGTNGSANSSANGGTPGYNYLWLPGGATTPAISGVSAGTYTLQVTDANGCIKTQTVTIAQPPSPLAVSVTTTNVLCSGGTDGTASSAVTGGTTPYTYNWMPGSISGQNIANVGTGTYTVNVTDANGCTTSGSGSITQPAAISLSSGSTNSTCGNPNGSATVSASGGTGAYTYFWSPSNQATSVMNGVPSGSYTVLVNDVNGCSATANVTINNTAGPVVTVTATNNVTCFGANNGTATTTVTGGTGTITYLWTPSGGSASTGTGLSTGIYTVTVTDANNCQSQATTSPITEPPAITTNVTTTSVACFGGNTGTASAAASGGSPGYTYLYLPGGATGASVSGLTAGTYTVQTTDSQGCINNQTFSVIEPSAALSVNTATTPVSCFGGTSGTTTATTAGGTAPYNYSWAPVGGNATTLSNLAAGTYSVTVTDNNGCTANSSITVSQPSAALAATGSSAATSCFGGSNGTGLVTPSGGTPNYTYSWSPSGGTGQTASGLAAGNYVVTVTDARSCSTNVSITVAQPAIISGTLDVVNATCGLANGSIDAQISGGTAPYTYLWSTSATTALINGANTGPYSVQVTDAQSCVQTFTTNVTNTPALLATVTSNNPASCFGTATGSATINITQGTAPYTIDWQPFGGSGLTAAGLAAGTYTANITDAVGCTNVTTTVTISEPNALTINIDSIINVSCNAGSNASITVTPNGGTPNYTYSWTPGSSSSSTLSNVGAGTFSVTVTDQNSCVTTISMPVTQPQALSSVVSSTTNPLCFGEDGSTAVTASGGTIPYSYLWTCVPPQTGSTMNDEPAGTYTCTITDANGCLVTSVSSITQPTQVVTTAGPDAIICLGNSGTLNATATGGTGSNYNFVWTAPPTMNSGQLNLTLAQTASYTVTAFDQNNCAGIPDTANYIVYDLNQSSITATGDSLICPGHSAAVYVLVNGTNTGPLTYSWTGLSGNGPGAYVVTPSVPTTYVVSVTNPCGMVIKDSIRVSFNPPPTIVLLGDTNKICAPDTVHFTDASITGNINDPINSWSWNFGDGTTSSLQNPSHVYTSPGNYNISVTVGTVGGCTNNNASAPFSVLASPYPTAGFTVNSTHLNLPYDQLICTNQSSGASPLTYVWNFGDGTQSTIKDPHHAYDAVGNFNIALIATSPAGCSDTAYQEITTDADVVFPNAFSPDPNGPSGGNWIPGDLSNNIFYPFTSGVVEYKMQVFNRWGELIFESTDVKVGWDGYYRGKLCQQDVYIWKAYLKLNNGKTYDKTGDITLLQ